MSNNPQLAPDTGASDRVLRLRGLLAELHRITKDVKPDIKAEEAVGVGRELRRIIERSQNVLEIVKTRVRNESPDQPGLVILDGPDGCKALVSTAEPRIMVRKETDIEKLRGVLGSRCFDRLFETHERVTPRADFNEEVVKLDDSHRKAALDAVDTQSPRARVSFPK